ncbi:kinase [Bifidobacterium lemurum]|uniref:Kinase n=1 Tax=Bifidobacterium lemurum TaxID=1603886 RepID=A0A261FR40_9BIFI|nr:serine/threonine-protein kinase [Bifidobacterium lemurum]OZG61266.1 kinase [Bifidobacterium lemurum]QOL34663.1 serine/threonine protein kinase [Bifidobacterium lemurum]
MINAPPFPSPPRLPGYDFIRVLGSGSTAVVLLYAHHTPSRHVAVKVSDPAAGSLAASALRHEAAVMARLPRHPHILRIFDSGCTDDGRAYIVVDYAEQGALADLLRHGPLPCARAVDVGVRLASGLYAAHRCGIIHHDIKPSNVLIGTRGLPILGDFGVSRDIYADHPAGHSPPWAAPEVLRGTSAGDEASDIYSLAATIFAMLAGASPYEHGYRPRCETELIASILGKPLPHIGRDDVPADVERALRMALDKNPGDRHYSALEFARALQRAQHASGFPPTPVDAENTPRYPDDLQRCVSGGFRRCDGSDGLDERNGFRGLDERDAFRRRKGRGMPRPSRSDTSHPTAALSTCPARSRHRAKTLAVIVAGTAVSATVAAIVACTVMVFMDAVPSPTGSRIDVPRGNGGYRLRAPDEALVQTAGTGGSIRVAPGGTLQKEVA